MRYRLRTLFVALTALCFVLGYLGCAFNWVRERQRFIAANHHTFFELATRSRPARYESPMLRFIGEAPVATIYVTVPTIRIQADQSEVQVSDPSQTVPRIKRLFPEAEVVAFPYRVGPLPGKAQPAGS